MNLIRILMIEDSATDALLFEAMLDAEKTFQHTLTRANRLADGLALIAAREFDVVLLDLGLPDSQGLATFEELHQKAPRLPIVVLTQGGDFDTAMNAIKKGAQDYLFKHDLYAFPLMRAVQCAIERERLKQQLHEALEQVKTLSGMLPICAGCKKIRDDKGYWNQVEIYIMRYSKATFSHGLCPACQVGMMEEDDLEVSDQLRIGARGNRGPGAMS